MEQLKLQSQHPLAAFFTGGRGFFALCRIAALFGCLFCLLIFAVNYTAISRADRLLPTLVYLCGLVLLFGGIALFLPGHRLILGLALGLGLLLRLSVILVTDTQPVSDFFYFYEGAQNILSGNASSYFDAWYFSMWPNTIPICYYYAGIFSLCNSILFAKLVNLTLMVGNIGLVYLLGTKIASPKAAALSALFYALAPSVIQTTGQLTNQHVALFFFLLGLWVLLSGKTLWAGALSGLLLALGNCFRSEGIVLYAALLVLSIFLLWDGKKERPLLRRRILALSGLFCSLLIVSTLLSGLITNLSGHSVKNDSGFAWKLIVGFNNEESGTFSGEDAEEFANTGDAWTIVKRRMGEIDNWPDFLYRKNTMMWGSYEDPSYSFSHLEHNQPVKIGPLKTDVSGLLRRCQDVDKAVYLLILLSFFASCLLLVIKKQGHSPAELLFLLIFDAYFCAYLLIEVAARYRYFILPFLLVLGSYGFSLLHFPKKAKNCEKI
ncbi:MAG: glycosyltransferase family 39 protein [Clostridia bacterium]|nr:glycosyltransferase family 39 protein [Clostridia bacterium]